MTDKEVKEFHNPKTGYTIKYSEISEKEFNELNRKIRQYWEADDISKRPKFTENELAFFLYENPTGKYIAINNLTGRPYEELFQEKNTALRYLSGECLDKLKDEECKYEIAIYKTKEDYEKKEPLQHDVVSDLEEARYELEDVMKNNSNYYSGVVIDQRTGKEEYAYYNNEHRYKIGIYETKEDWDSGEPFEHDVKDDLEEAKYELDNVMKINNYYSGFVLDRKTGIEEYAFYSDEQQKNEEDEEEDEI